MKTHDDVDDDGNDDTDNGYERRPRSPDLSSSLFAAFFCHSHSREPPTFSLHSVLNFSHPQTRQAVCLIHKGERRIEIWSVGRIVKNMLE